MTKRFCCWCGKVEHTKTCKSKSLKECADKIVKAMPNKVKKERRCKCVRVMPFDDGKTKYKNGKPKLKWAVVIE